MLPCENALPTWARLDEAREKARAYASDANAAKCRKVCIALYCFKIQSTHFYRRHNTPFSPLFTITRAYFQPSILFAKYKWASKHSMSLPWNIIQCRQLLSMYPRACQVWRNVVKFMQFVSFTMQHAFISCRLNIEQLLCETTGFFLLLKPASSTLTFVLKMYGNVICRIARKGATATLMAAKKLTINKIEDSREEIWGPEERPKDTKTDRKSCRCKWASSTPLYGGSKCFFGRVWRKNKAIISKTMSHKAVP